MTRRWLPTVLLGLGAAAALGLPALLFGDDSVATMFHDDAYYYATAARHLAAGHGFTFDGVHATNGFHPFWLLLEAGVFALTPGDAIALRVIVLLQAALVGLAAALLWDGLRARVGAAAALVGALVALALPGAFWVLAGGMETALALLALVAVWRAHQTFAAASEPSPRDGAALGLLLALAFLARLELLAAAPLVWLSLRRRPALVQAVVFAPVAVVVAAYLAWNRLAFDLWLPVSGAVKSTFVARLPLGRRLEALLSFPWIGQQAAARLVSEPLASRIGAALLVALAGLLVWRRRAVAQAVAHAGVGLPLLACAAVIAGDAILVGSWLSWYQGPIFLATALALAAALGHARRLAPTAAALLLGLLVVRLPARVSTFADPVRQWAYAPVVAARWVRLHTPGDAVFGSFNGGVVGFFSGRTVVNLDGLANDAHYFRDVLLGRRFDEYLARERIGWLVDSGCRGSPTPAEDLLRYLQFAGGTADLSRYQQVFHYTNPTRADGCPGYAVWKVLP